EVASAQLHAAKLVENDAAKLLVFENAQLFGAGEMFECFGILLQLNLAQAEHGVRGTISWTQRHESCERASRGSVLIFVVLQGAKGPPSFRPARFQRKRFAVESIGIVEPIFLAGLRRLRGKLLERLLGG